MKNKISVIPNKIDEHSNNLLQGIIEYINNIKTNPNIKVSSIAIAIKTTGDDDLMTFNGGNLTGLSGILNQLQFRINQMINDYSEDGDFEFEFETEE